MANSPSRLLVVDDNEMNRDVLSRRLQRQGYTVEQAEDGEQALQLLESSSYDLVLLDIMMPKLNGYEVLTHMKASPQLQLTPVIVISAVDELDSIVQCIQLGAEDYLFKPFNPVILKARVSATLEKHHLRMNASQSHTIINRLASDLRPSLELIHNHAEALLSQTQHTTDHEAFLQQIKTTALNIDSYLNEIAQEQYPKQE